MAKTRRKGIQPRFALARYVPREKIENPFGEFVRKLVAHFQEQRTSAGAVRWTTFPLEYALASGFWPILLAIAKELGKSLATPHQVTVVATKVNQLLCASIMAVFPNLEQMVEEFEKNVVWLLDKAIALGFRPGMNISLAVWRQLRLGEENVFVTEIQRANAQQLSGDSHLLFQAPVALFFMDIIKAGRQKYARWLAEYDRLVRWNTFSDELMFGWAEVDNDLRAVRSRLEFFDLFLEVDPRFLGKYSSEHSASMYNFSNIEDLLRILGEDIALAHKLPVKVAALSRRMELDLYFAGSVDFSWIHSQLLITAGDLPEREWILTTEFPAALAALKKMDLGDLVEKTLARWQAKRKFSPTPEDEAGLREMLLYRGQFMKHWAVSRRNEPVQDIDATIYQLPKIWRCR